MEVVVLHNEKTEDELTEFTDDPPSLTENMKTVTKLIQKREKRTKSFHAKRDPLVRKDRYFSVNPQTPTDEVRLNSGFVDNSKVKNSNSEEEIEDEDEDVEENTKIIEVDNDIDEMEQDIDIKKEGERIQYKTDVTEELITIEEKKKEKLMKDDEKKDEKIDVELDINTPIGEEIGETLTLSTCSLVKSKKTVKSIIDRIKDEKLRITSNAKKSDPYLKKIPPNGLLNLYDSEFVKLKIITYNMEGISPSSHENFYRLFETDTQHMFIVGTQECERNTGSSFFNTSKANWTKIVRACCSRRYIPLATSTLVATNLIIVIRKELKRYFKNVHSYTVPCGYLNFFGDKGATAISLDFGRTSFMFINAHLTNKDYNIDKRCEDYHKIIRKLEKKICKIKKKKACNIFKEFNHVFFFGDLNFRVNGLRPLANKLLELGMVDVLMANDQLGIAKRRKKAFTMFKEEKITFLPTFKFNTGTDSYDTGKKQHVPSWCDRILYYSNERIVPLEYNADFTFTLSDHRPVFGRFLCYVDATPLEPPEPDETYEDSKKVRKQRNANKICTFL